MEALETISGSVSNRTTSTKQTSSISSTDPIFNKNVIIGVFVFFATILILIVLVHVIRILRRRCSLNSQSELLYGGIGESFEDSMEAEDDDDDDDLVDLYTSCQLYVDDPEMNATSDNCSDLDCVSVAEGERGSFVNEYNERERSESMEKTRGLLSRHFLTR